MIKARERFQHGATISIKVILFLVLCEIILRIGSHFVFLNILHPEAYLGKKPEPFSYQFGFQLNSQGFKGAEFNSLTNKDLKIVALGDSFTFAAVPYQHSYLNIVEKLLSNNSTLPGIINLGIPGIGPKDYLSVLVHEGLEVQPDMILLTLFIGDDIIQSSPQSWFQELYVMRLYSYIVEHYKNRPALQIGTQNVEHCDTCPVLPNNTFMNLMTERLNFYQTDSQLLQRNIQPTLSIIKQISAICDDNSITLAVVIAPDVIQVESQLQARIIKTTTTTAPGYQFDKPNNVLAHELEMMDIPYLDLLPFFINGTTPLYLPRDVHWNIAGNTLAAKQVSLFINEIHGKRDKKSKLNTRIR